MNTDEFLSYLRGKDLRIWAADGDLHCDAPKGVLTPALRAELADRKAEIVDFLGRISNRLNGELRPLPRDTDLPLSFAEQRMWFLIQLDPEDPSYNEPKGIRISGILDANAVQRALAEIVLRHEVLRTTFVSVAGQPARKIVAHRSFELPLVDLTTLSDRNRNVEVNRLLVETTRKPFDLSRDLMLRALLIRISNREHVLLLVTHHIASDGRSGAILWNELVRLYEHFASGGPLSSLPELSIQYADYAFWQRRWLQGDALKDQISYWKKQLDRCPTLRLPIDRPRPASQVIRGARQSLMFPADMTDALHAFSRERSVTLFMTLLAAFQTLLFRYTGQENLVVGSPIAGRTRHEFENLIGFFVNTLVLRTDLSGDPTFNKLLQRVRQACLGAYDHQDVPFEKLVEELRPDRQLTNTPLFQVMFAFRNAVSRSAELPGLVWTSMEVESGTAKFDLSVTVQEEGEELRALMEYNADVFETAKTSRMLSHYENLLRGIVADPDRRLSELPLLCAMEERQLLVEWNDTKRNYPKDKCIHQLFETQVEKTPDAIAVIFEDHRLTYRELNNRANQLAHYLRKLGVGPEMLVGVCVERSIEMVVGLLGILKAGGAYVPLDPSYPAERLEFMLADARVSVLLTQSDLFKDGGSRMDDSDRRTSILDPRMQRVRLDRDWELIARESDANAKNSTTADNLAYVIYTSGSTGQPKGVQITHESLLNLVFWHHQAFSVTPIDRATQLAGPGFDATVWELWPYLTVGASIHIPDEMTRLDAASLRDWLVAQTITISFVPAALAESLMSLDWPQETELRILLTGGDTLQAYPPDTLPFRVFNNYGPTECTVVATSGHVLPNTHTVHPSMIGRPIANTRIYILDAQRNPVPIGVVGEIYIGGDGVARGYLNRPEMTAERFIYHSFDGGSERRLYRTGDLARYLPDGNIEFLGRMDNQVKIRGYRIELEEIEAVLRNHPAGQQCVVAVRADTAGDKRLIGYVVAAQHGTPIDVRELRNFLKQKLPDYMIPSNFVFLDSLPLTPNGKVDRRALLAPDQSRPEIEQSFIAPRTPVEEILAQVWREVLKLEKVGTHDNFFDLGGHSLLATQVVSRVRQLLQVEVPLRTMFEAPTVEGLALIITQQQAKKAGQEDLNLMLREVESLSETDAERILADLGK